MRCQDLVGINDPAKADPDTVWGMMYTYEVAGIVSSGLATRDVAMTPEGDEFYFGVFVGNRAMIMESRLQRGRWTEKLAAQVCLIRGCRLSDFGNDFVGCFRINEE